MQTDEYVILDKINRFRQDIQIEIVALFIKFSENNDIRAPWPLSLCGIAPTKEVLNK